MTTTCVVKPAIVTISVAQFDYFLLSLTIKESSATIFLLNSSTAKIAIFLFLAILISLKLLAYGLQTHIQACYVVSKSTY